MLTLMRPNTVLAYMALAACLALTGASRLCAQDESAADGALPEFDSVTEAVESHFAQEKNRRELDIISQGDLAAVLQKLEALGWEVADRDEIEESVLADGDSLVAQLRTKQGRKFMEQVSGMPLGYDRLDRLSRLSDGRQLVRRLIAGPDGHKLLSYMTSADGGRELGRMLSNAPDGEGFNDPTGRIYTVEQLLKRLKQSHDEAQEPADGHGR